jgi:hypothetical protein
MDITMKTKNRWYSLPPDEPDLNGSELYRTGAGSEAAPAET